MKKLLFIFLFIAGTATAQVPGQDVDSLMLPAKTDSADFSNSSYKTDTTQKPHGTPPARRDSLPLDDRKPKGPPKK